MTEKQREMKAPIKREFWIKMTSFKNVGMGGFRYSEAEISVDPDCGKNYEDFKGALHVVSAEWAESEIQRLKEALREAKKYICDRSNCCMPHEVYGKSHGLECMLIDEVLKDV